MAGASVLTTAIPAAATLLGAVVALGGVMLTSWASARQDERRSRHDDDRVARERLDAERRELIAACTGLLASAAQLRVGLQILGQRYWVDMNIKLQTVQDQVMAVSKYASQVAVLTPGVAGDAALALSMAAGELVAEAVREASVGRRSDPAQQHLGGELPVPLNLDAFDGRVQEFRRAATEVGGGMAGPDGPPPAPLGGLAVGRAVPDSPEAALVRPSGR
jgi:hypothetical protein